MKYAEVITKDGDRVDLLAYKYYGLATEVNPILDANPHIQNVPILPSALTLKIPVIDRAAVVDSSLLPPWRK